ncbi:flagellar hook-basal body complex protein FliE [Thiospirochaeta perfilievii]|uniref:Flagellar hook-basal body complex protein FliE n=1 Tax=Thiospirochaeta perfilievii TaxID=252967 RepID=A0A5C1Q6W1_9SPIO|nr:flagellar hook-basal body complex protein FliE [Thiospirochaeta perfilievii]QEN03735.1 flagellar hook-basal body complex protein FliE [Thiospirochaeta perfilievii]
MSILDVLSNNQVSGDLVDIKRTNPLHLNIDGEKTPLTNSDGATFEELMLEAVNGVNSDQMESADLMQQMITNPDSVDTHDLTIAMAKAEMSLNVTKAVIDKAVSAYKEITSLR